MARMWKEKYNLVVMPYESSYCAKLKPDCVLVYGDCLTTLQGALDSIYSKLPLGHIEAGLRSHDFRMFEERCRRAVDQMSDFLFCPFWQAQANLRVEDVLGTPFLVGDVMYDLFLSEKDQLSESEDAGEYDVLTLHRAENVDDAFTLQNLLFLVQYVSADGYMPSRSMQIDYLQQRDWFSRSGVLDSEIPVRWVLHHRVTDMIESGRIEIPGCFEFHDPMDHVSMLNLINNARFVFTDSGGLYKEALWLGKKVFMLRVRHEYEGCRAEDFGDGNAAEKIVKILEEQTEGG
ncbi:MAG: UDP-N-acetylglucosamine 2-epimerase [Methanosarcinales archaeon]